MRVEVHRIVGVAVIAVLAAACGRLPINRLRDDAAVVGGGDAAGGAGGDASSDAGAADASCDALQAQAQAAFDILVAANRGCAADPDCAVISVPGRCLNGCNYFLNVAAVPALTNAANNQCAPFIAAGCPFLTPPCPPPLSAVCEAGMCVSPH